MVRDPFARIELHYNFMLKNPAWTRGITDEHLVQTSNYYLYAADYSRVFGRENLMILDYEALSADPRGTVNRGNRGFLGLAPVAAIADPSARNVTVPPKSSSSAGCAGWFPPPSATVPREALKRQVRRIVLAALRPNKTRLTPSAAPSRSPRPSPPTWPGSGPNTASTSRDGGSDALAMCAFHAHPAGRSMNIRPPL